MDVAVNFKGVESFINLPPVFSDDGENVFVCSRKSILEYNSKTGMLIHEYKAPDDKVIGFSYHKYDSYDCISACTKNGRVILWKTVTHFKLIEKQLPLKKVLTFHIVPRTKGEPKAFLSHLNKKEVNFSLVAIGENKPELKYFNIRLENSKKKYYMSLNNHQYSAIAYDDTLYFLRLDNPRDISRVSLANRTFTCIASHPSEEIVLTGDNSGRVIVWQNIFSKRKTQAVFHWHTLPVHSVCFSSSGSYFYSGGDECVLVKWQLENVNDRRFIPRLASEINHINVANNNLYVAVSTRDNAIRIFDSTLNQITLIQNLVLGNHFDCGIVYDPRTKALIMNGNQGHVQFFSPNDMSLMYNIDIVGRNKITNERNCTMINTEITKIDISKCGLWLVAVEERKDNEYSPEIRLKFWKFDETKQMFELNTSVEFPHEHSINSILFRPVNKSGNLCCVTVGNDKKFKVWQLTEFTTTHSTGVRWECYCVGFYRNLNCKSLSFSVDGSLMATAFESIMTAWIPDTCQLKCSLVHPIYKDDIKQVQFGCSSQCHLLVSISHKQISVWNLLTLSMIWTVRIPSISLLIADPLSTYMVAFTFDKHIFVFSPATPSLIYSSDSLLKKYDTVITATFVPSKYSHDARMKWYERTQIYFITSSNKLYCICSNELEHDLEEYMEDSIETTYNSILPKYKSDSFKLTEPIKQMFEDVGHTEIKKYLEFPIHTMAPIRFTCQSLIKSLVLQKEMI